MKKIQLNSLLWASISSLALITAESNATQHNNVTVPPSLSVAVSPINNNFSGFGSSSCLNSLFACAINISNITPTQIVTISSNDSTVTIGTFSTSSISGFATISFPLDPNATTTSCKVPCAVQFNYQSAGLSSFIYFIGTSSNGLQTQTSNIPITTQAF